MEGKLKTETRKHISVSYASVALVSFCFPTTASTPTLPSGHQRGTSNNLEFMSTIVSVFVDSYGEDSVFNRTEFVNKAANNKHDGD